jgi:hypothetical protein
MELDQDLLDRLQRQANIALALHFDGSDDWWHYVMVDGQEWGINIWDDCMWGDATGPLGTKWGPVVKHDDFPDDDGRRSMKITAYPCNEDGLDTSDWVCLAVDKFPLWVMEARLKVKEVF